MKAPSFSYLKPASPGEVSDPFDRRGDSARILAGGQNVGVGAKPQHPRF